jgi:hypothetical protein
MVVVLVAVLMVVVVVVVVGTCLPYPYSKRTNVGGDQEAVPCGCLVAEHVSRRV